MKSRYAFKLAANVINGLVNIATVSIVPRTLGSSEFGMFTYLQNFFLQATSILDSGTSLAFFSKLSARNNRTELLSFYACFSLLTLIILALFSGTLQFKPLKELFLPGIPQELILFGMMTGFGTWFAQILSYVGDAYALTRATETLKIAYRLSFLALLIFLILFVRLDLKTYFAFQITCLGGLIVFFLALLFKHGALSSAIFSSRVDFKTLGKEFFDFVSPLILFNIFSSLAGIFDLWLLQKIYGSEETAYYSLAFQVACMAFIFTSAMTPVIMREFSKSLAEGDTKRVAELFIRHVRILYSVSACLGLFVFFNSSNIVRVFAGEGFLAASLTVAIMGFYPIHQTYGQLAGAIYYATGQTRMYRNIGLTMALFSCFVAPAVLVWQKLGAPGLATKMVILQIISVNLLTHQICRKLDIGFSCLISHQILSLPFFAITAFGAASINCCNNSVQNLFISGITYTTIIVISACFFPSVFAIQKK